MAKTATTVGSVKSAWMRACVLLLLGEQPSHGYELLTNLEGCGVHGVDSGTLYRLLRRSERDGLTRSSWEPAGSGPPRRIYELTVAGNIELEGITADLVSRRAMTDRFLERAVGLSSTISQLG